MSNLRTVPALLGLLLALALPAQAQQAEPDDPPDRVGRVAVVEGSVSLRTPEQTDWQAAILNYPIAAGTAVYTESGARTELNFGNAAIRLDGLTEAAITRLEDGAVGLRVDRGIASLRIAHPVEGTRIAVDTPRGRFDIITAGTYRIEAGGDDRPTRIAVLEGEARFAGRTYQAVRTGETLDIRGNPETVTQDRAERTAFDDWAMARDRAAEAPQTERHVSTATPGYQELDRAGTWQQTPEYGAVWYPTAVPVGWAPYRHGHWAWVSPWGWTWIDDAPWGFAPFHYGRWAYYRDRWCWVPGPVVRRPVYAPALVVFVGGPTLVIEIGGRRRPAVGWVPLAPREIYRPPYRHSTTYVRNINITHVERNVVNNIHVHDRDRDDDRRADRFANRRGATVVPEEAMRRSERIDRTAIRRDDDGPSLNDARVTRDLPQRSDPSEQRRGPPVRSLAPETSREQPEQRSPRGERPREGTLRLDNPPAAATPDARPRFERKQEVAPQPAETRRGDGPPRFERRPESRLPQPVQPQAGQPQARQPQARQPQTERSNRSERRPEGAAPPNRAVQPMVIEPQQRLQQQQPRTEQPRSEQPRSEQPRPERSSERAPERRMQRPEPQAKQVERTPTPRIERQARPQPQQQQQPQAQQPPRERRGGGQEKTE